MTQYLKFHDEATAISVLSQFRGPDQDGNEIWITASHTHALDVVGTIYKPTGVTLPSSEPGMPDFPEMAPVPGFHVNFIGELPAGATPYVVEPANPSRVFAE